MWGTKFSYATFRVHQLLDSRNHQSYHRVEYFCSLPQLYYSTAPLLASSQGLMPMTAQLGPQTMTTSQYLDYATLAAAYQAAAAAAASPVNQVANQNEQLAFAASGYNVFPYASAQFGATATSQGGALTTTAAAAQAVAAYQAAAAAAAAANGER